MERVGIVVVNDLELFKEINTFQCRLGRFSPEACQRLRERKGDSKYNSDDGLRLEMPWECRNCDEWEKKWEEVYEKRRKYLEELKRKEDLIYEGKRKWRGKCSVCGKVNRLKIVGKRVCKTCYEKVRKRRGYESGRSG